MNRPVHLVRSRLDPDQRRSPVSIVILVGERPTPLASLYRELSAPLREARRSFDFVFALDPRHRAMAHEVQALADEGEPISIVTAGLAAGDTGLFEVGVDAARFDVIVALPAYRRVEAEGLEPLIRAVEAGADFAWGVRVAQGDSRTNRVQKRIFHALLMGASGARFRDVGSGVFAVRRRVLESIPLHGDLIRFLPVLVAREGFVAVEEELPQHEVDKRRRIYSPGVYLRRLLDLLGLFFLLRFTQRPLRFFGLVGSVLSLSGSAVLLALAVQKLGGRAIGDRPLLVLGTLLLVVGVQSIALGLVGETIVFLTASRARRYRIRPDRRESPERPQSADVEWPSS